MKDRDRIERLIAEYEVRLSQLRGTLALLDLEDNGRGRPARHPRASTALSAAIALQAERNGNGNGAGHKTPKHKQPGYHTADGIKARRARTAELLATFDHNRPTPAEGLGKGARGIGAMVARGYLKRKGEGYVRTSKEFVP